MFISLQATRWGMFITFFFFNDTATTEIYTRSIVGSVRCVQETGIEDVKNLLRIIGFYENGNDEVTVIEIIHSHQIEEREENVLNLDEFIAFCEELNFIPLEEVISNTDII
eukprot:TRINITY_DN18984_c0_g1_i2.p2 TRINITY_DN18984_c0_g1~~TRINITY_DN18984_c0_g1_i2.p2  ORF type:complete len:111 (+),score=33.33 TRINITY_DN18984_c0_g1_i2:71-403(+)